MLLTICGCITAICLIVLTVLTIISKINNSNKSSKLDDLTFEQLFEIVNIIVNNEISIYERNIFDNGGKLLDRSTYDTYYKDIFGNVLKALSDDLINHITPYLTRESFFNMVSRQILMYLNSKVI